MADERDKFYPPPEKSSVADRFTDPGPFEAALEKLAKAKNRLKGWLKSRIDPAQVK